MSIYEDNIIILLRKMVAISIPDSFEATEDTNRNVIIDKLKIEHPNLFDAINNFIIAFEARELIRSDYQIKLKDPDIYKTQYEVLNKTLVDKKVSLLKTCKQNHIDINYELSKLLDDGNFSK